MKLTKGEIEITEHSYEVKNETVLKEIHSDFYLTKEQNELITDSIVVLACFSDSDNDICKRDRANY